MDSAPPSTQKKKEDPIPELEQEFILRLPPGTSMALQRDVELGGTNLRDRLSIEINPETRNGRVAYGGHIYNAKLVDLPCIIETLKTTDNKTFYKVADICQMLLADNELVPKLEANANKEKKFQWPHGITPPLKNVRKRRFRKTLKKKDSDRPDMENEVKRLLRMDNEAIDVRWEVVIEEDQPADPNTADKKVLLQGEAHKVLPSLKRRPLIDLPDIPEDAMQMSLFGEISESDNDDDEEEIPSGGESRRPIDAMKEATKHLFGELTDSEDDDEELDLTLLAEGGNDVLSMVEGNADGDMEDDYGDSLGASTSYQSDPALQIQLDSLAAQLQEFQQQIEDQQEAINNAQSEDERNILNEGLSEILAEQKKVQTEYEILASMFNQDSVQSL